MAPPAQCSVIIATLARTESLRVVLDCLACQSRPPCEIIIVAAGDAGSLAGLSAAGPAPVIVRQSGVKSAARQRNQGAEAATGDVLAFLDDDIEFAPDLFARVLAHFDRPAAPGLGAVSPRIANADSPPPGRLTRAYYALQAGYTDPDFGGRLFGPGINCFPVFRSGGPELVPVEWLPSTCLFMRATLFQAEQFPRFDGYSFAEDVHLTARVARAAPLFFLREPSILHHSGASEFKADAAALTAGKLHNMAVVAREVLGRRGWALWWRWQLHRLFLTAVLVLRRPACWRDELRGVRAARL